MSSSTSGPIALRHGAKLRLILSAVIGLGVGVVTGLTWFWAGAILAGWGATCVVFIVSLWARIWRMDPARTREHATSEEPGRTTSEVLIVLASVGSLVALSVVILQARASTGIEQGLLAGFSVLSVAMSWALIHTIYTLRYARMYFAAPEGGIDFNQEEAPQYSDFAYLSFDLGMTYQVSDTTLRSSELRRTVLKHTLLSYLFGSVILATVINLVAGL
ncbi:DUF1345 domain-containing protein [Plantibacter sp. MCCC 1A11337]|uniref:DUF1345 domain-containing protein n=1 Tax=Plantibacter sp. MCCC 1A11337 TaxID=2736644 RepID=UPI00346D230F